MKKHFYVLLVGLTLMGCRADLAESQAQEAGSLKRGVALVAIDGTLMTDDARPSFEGSTDQNVYLQQGGVMTALYQGFNWTAKRYVRGPDLFPERGVYRPLAVVEMAEQALCRVASLSAVESIVLAGYSRGVAIGLTALKRIHTRGGCRNGSGVYPKVAQFLFIENVPLCIVPKSSSDSSGAESASEDRSLVDIFEDTIDVCADLNLNGNDFRDGVVNINGEEISWGLDWLTELPFAENNGVAFECLHLARHEIVDGYSPVREPWRFPVQTVSLKGKCLQEDDRPEYMGTRHDGMGFSIAARDTFLETISRRFGTGGAGRVSSPSAAGESSPSDASESSFSCPEGMTRGTICSQAQTKQIQDGGTYLPVYTQLPPSGATAHSSGMAKGFKVDVAGVCEPSRGGSQSLGRFALVQKAEDQHSSSFGADQAGKVPKVWIDANYLECR